MVFRIAGVRLSDTFVDVGQNYGSMVRVSLAERRTRWLICRFFCKDWAEVVRYPTLMISYVRSPPGAENVTSSPTLFPMSARPRGELMEMVPFWMSHS